ncbi:MAG: serine/threonine protein phosphatase [Actinobacteria bacterium]|nr:serine/threonine protein phosphatase [Actinomycetota bacterium]
MSRLIAVGDIHGQYNKLRDLIDALELSGKDEVVFLGDYVDAGPQSADVIEYLMTRATYYQHWHMLLGNHDSWFLDYCMSGEVDPAWFMYGGRETLRSYGGPGEPIPRAHIDFLQRLHKPLKLPRPYGGREYIFSHGMLCPTKPIESRFDKDDALWGRPSSFGITKDSDWGPLGVWKWERDQYLVFGHTPHNEPTEYDNRALCIDTGAKSDNRPLTAVVLPRAPGDEPEFLQAW